MKVLYFLLSTAAILGATWSETVPCDLRQTKYGSVCVCTAQHCDYLENPEPAGTEDIALVSSSKAGLRFATSSARFGSSEPFTVDYSDYSDSSLRSYEEPIADEEGFDPISLLLDETGRSFLELSNPAKAGSYVTASRASSRSVRLNVDRQVKHQRITGFGGSFTGAVSHILQQVDQKLQDQVYRSFFAKDGIGFNMLRMSIGGCDFDLEPWAYNEEPRDDPALSNFTRLDARDELKLLQLERMKQVAQLDEIKIKAAAWSAPPWMKSNNKWTGTSHLKPEYYQAWADYHLRFLELMASKNMPIWAISTGNEPLNGVFFWYFVRFMSMGWTPRNQAVWLADHLGPMLRNSSQKHVLVFGNDDQRYTFPAWFNLMNASRPNSLDYLDGLAVHWYWDEIVGPGFIDAAHQAMPAKLLINTESCVGDKPWQTHGPELGSWPRAEKYMRAYLQDLQHDFNGWIDWNIVLDEQGGPNYVDNFVDAPTVMNMTSLTELYKQPIFYAIGHFSKFVPEGSVRIDHQLSNINVDAVAFRRPDQRVALIVFNSGRAPVNVELVDSVRGQVTIIVPDRSIHTLIYN